MRPADGEREGDGDGNSDVARLDRILTARNLSPAPRSVAPRSGGLISSRDFNLASVLMWPSWLCGVGLTVPGFAGPDTDRTPHNLSSHSVRRKFISPSSSFHGLPLELLATSQLANALAFISRSTSAYTFVVAQRHVPQPGSDRVDVHPRAKQMRRGRVTNRVRADSLGYQRGHLGFAARTA